MIPRGNSTAFPNTPKVVDMPAYKRINIEEETMTQTILINISVERFIFFVFGNNEGERQIKLHKKFDNKIHIFIILP